MKRRVPWHWIIAGALLLAGAGWLFSRLEWVEEKTRTGLRGEAARDPHYAARLLVQKLGYHAEEVKDSTRLASLPTDSTLFMSALLSQSLARHMEPRMRDWVGRGGHLVVIIPGPEQSDRFVASLGIRRLGRHSSDSAETIQVEGQKLRVRFPDCDVFSVSQPLVWSGSVKSYHRYPRRKGEAQTPPEDDGGGDDDGEKTAGAAPTELVNENAFAVARWSLGKGRVSAICDNRPLTSVRIGQDDQAALAARLLIDDRPGTIYFAADSDAPSLLAWLSDNAPQAMIAVGLLIMAGLWFAIPRFGPIRPDPLPQRPGLRTHLAAVAAFHIRHRAWDKLLGALREEFQRQLKNNTRHGGATEPADFAAQYGLDAAALREALDAQPRHRHDFDRHARLLGECIAILAARGAAPTSSRQSSTP
ncbi:DUF4350 domain-containing protein [Niveibacterium sp. SC-1]|uniref:DUF4350 domain-containing protein n=1 Tax=Niveibacterium sp. SC-1 TaxID=3135646 RepID=UPI00311F25EF